MRMEPQENYVLRTVEERGVRLVRLWFTDVLGQHKSVAISPAELSKVFEEGLQFDGSSIDGFSRVQESDVLARPDARSFELLPWARDDQMPEPRAMNIAVFIDDVTAANGPLLFIPGSHKQGVIDAGHDVETTSYPLWTLDREMVSKLAERGGCVAPTGPAGSMLLFSSLLVHASPANISPLNRTIVYLSLCHVDNHIRQFKRPEWIAHRDFEPIEPLADDCLMELVEERRLAAAE